MRSVLRTQVIIVSMLLSAMPALANPLTQGQPPSTIKLEGDLGGKVNGDLWNSDEIAKTGKVISLFYVDPEEKKLNEAVEEAYENEHFPPDKHGSVAIINMAAAWYPNSMINSQLQKKQERFPRTTYVKDMKKTLVKEWDMLDDSVNVAVFGKDGKVIFIKRGKMNPPEIGELMKLIRSNL